MASNNQFRLAAAEFRALAERFEDARRPAGSAAWERAKASAGLATMLRAEGVPERMGVCFGDLVLAWTKTPAGPRTLSPPRSIRSRADRGISPGHWNTVFRRRRPWAEAARR